MELRKRNRGIMMTKQIPRLLLAHACQGAHYISKVCRYPNTDNTLDREDPRADQHHIASFSKLVARLSGVNVGT